MLLPESNVPIEMQLKRNLCRWDNRMPEAQVVHFHRNICSRPCHKEKFHKSGGIIHVRIAGNSRCHKVKVEDLAGGKLDLEDCQHMESTTSRWRRY